MSRSFPEGITLLAGPDGVEIRVDDYHARPLKLSWQVIDKLRRDSRSARAPGEGDSG